MRWIKAAQAHARDGKLADPILRAEIARTAIDTYASEATRRRYLAEAGDGGEIGARSALLKYDGTELNKRRHELMMSLAGADGLYFDGNLGPDPRRRSDWLRSKGNSIEGGTSEIMLDIVAKRLLELPGTEAAMLLAERRPEDLDGKRARRGRREVADCRVSQAARRSARRRVLPRVLAQCGGTRLGRRARARRATAASISARSARG